MLADSPSATAESQRQSRPRFGQEFKHCRRIIQHVGWSLFREAAAKKRRLSTTDLRDKFTPSVWVDAMTYLVESPESVAATGRPKRTDKTSLAEGDIAYDDRRFELNRKIDRGSLPKASVTWWRGERQVRISTRYVRYFRLTGR